MTDYLKRANRALGRLFTQRHNFVTDDSLAKFCDYDKMAIQTVENYLKSNCSGIFWLGETPYDDCEMGFWFDNPTEEQEKTYWFIYFSPKTFPFNFDSKYLANSLKEALSLDALKNAETFILSDELTLAVTDSHFWLIQKKTFNKKSR